MNHDNLNEPLNDEEIKDLTIKTENSENDSKSVQCYFCDLVLKNSQIEAHINEKHGENKPVIFLSVNKNGKRISTRNSKLKNRPKINFDEEENINAADVENKCEICDEILTSKWSLQNHKLKKHNDILGIGFQCRKCDYTAKDAKRLKEHESSKHNPKFQCKFFIFNYILVSLLTISKFVLEGNLQRNASKFPTFL